MGPPTQGKAVASTPGQSITSTTSFNADDGLFSDLDTSQLQTWKYVLDWRTATFRTLEGTELPENPQARDLNSTRQRDKLRNSRAIRAVEEEKPLPSLPRGEETLSAARQPYTLREKFGWLAVMTLIAGTAVIIGPIAFLTFLWFGNEENPTWHAIATRDWMTRASSISALVIRNAVSLQSSVATGMIAALSLEKCQVLLSQLAAVSIARHSNSGPYALTWIMTKMVTQNPRRWRVIVIPLLLFATTSLVQLTSTALLSDLVLFDIKGPTFERTLATNFQYQCVPEPQPCGFPTECDAIPKRCTSPAVYLDNYWNVKAPFFPTFAEYREKASELPEGVSDTGLTLRAYLPIADQASRFILRNYSGKATVIDTRVICMRPEWSNQTLRAFIDFQGNLGLLGDISPSVHVPHLDVCTKSTEFAASLTLEKGWKFFLYQLNNTDDKAGGLFSEFEPLSGGSRCSNESKKTPQSRLAYLALNITAASGNMNATKSLGPPSVTVHRGQWTDFNYLHADLQISSTLCYSALNSADLDIQAYGNKVRTEPRPVIDNKDLSYRFDDVRKQLGLLAQNSQVSSAASTQDRGILCLHPKDSWVPTDNSSLIGRQMSYLQYAVNPSTPLTPTNSFIAGSMDFFTIAGASIFSLKDYTSSTRALFIEHVLAGGSIGSAIQAIHTIITGMAYYDQIPGFNNHNNVSEIFIVPTLVPRLYKGYTAVMIVLIIHLVLLAVILHLFLKQTSISTLDNAWQVIAQIMGEDTEEILARASLMPDSEVERDLEGAGKKRRFVGIGLKEDGSGSETVTHSTSVKMKPGVQH